MLLADILTNQCKNKLPLDQKERKRNKSIHTIVFDTFRAVRNRLKNTCCGVTMESVDDGEAEYQSRKLLSTLRNR